MADTFDERIEFLDSQVGHGNLTAGCTVDQPYAQDQHETATYQHDDGVANYLGDPLMRNSSYLMESIALATITEAGSRLAAAMRDVADEMVGYVAKYAPTGPDEPREGDIVGRLAGSGHGWVDDGGVRVYEKLPKYARRRGESPPGWHRE
jgi:hypothetical protein